MDENSYATSLADVTPLETVPVSSPNESYRRVVVNPETSSCSDVSREDAPSYWYDTSEVAATRRETLPRKSRYTVLFVTTP